ncbi:sugar-binding transcriptional regulator [Stagnihabitans tardus]|uniref:Sugar-binding transcriptional regulator n=1 Tax=Stagnihabitans tardus TaxID=2699202 RepID=A0AAE4Y8A3_9RHOB|nr:sugar-binding transcriptional regulator [Stagnihabitans tardus]NBZ87763.1 sugar-binding transcriptional regulator [Stagnihabitans tardus]
MAQRPDPEQDLSIRAAWLHYVGGLTQAEVARRLQVPSVKAHRLIARAVAEGVVRVSITGKAADCASLEAALCARFGLTTCEVAPDLGETDLPLRALGQAGADYLRRAIESGAHQVIGLSHGRTLLAAVRQLPRTEAPGLRFVSLLGGLTRSYAANPHDVMYRIAETCGAQAHILPVPFYANSVEDRAVLLSQPGVADLFALTEEASLKLVGVGTVERDAQLVTSGMIGAGELAAIRAEGGVAEMLGHFFDEHGHVLTTALTRRTLATTLDAPRQSRIVAIAGGPGKTGALRAILSSGRLMGLITDETTARALLAPPT